MFFRLAALALTALFPMLSGAQSAYQEGTHYHTLATPQPTEVSTGKVEVVEIFSYACVHCANFEPFIAAWKRDMPEQAEFRGLPAVFSPSWEPFARAYYAAQALGELDKLHNPLFKALHVDKERLTTVELIADFAAKHGIDREAFIAAANSSTTDVKIRRGQEQMQKYQIEGTPSIVVAGKYRVPTVSGYQEMLQVVNFLVAREAGAAATTGS